MVPMAFIAYKGFSLPTTWTIFTEIPRCSLLWNSEITKQRYQGSIQYKNQKNKTVLSESTEKNFVLHRAV